MKKALALVLLILLLPFSLFALSEDAKYTYSVLPADKQVKRGSPFKEDAIALARKTGTIRFYFMHGEGIDMGGSTGTKWGDSTLIVFPNGEVMLIDAGMANYSKTLVHNLKILGIDKIDYAVLSHNHPDHFAGFFGSAGILKNFKVGTFYWNGLNCDYNTNQAKIFSSGIKSKNIGSMEVLEAGDVIEISDDIKIEVFAPSQKNKEDFLRLNQAMMSEAMNSLSLALKITYKDFSALFCGDMYIEREEEICALYGDRLDVDLVKANHHGKDSSNCKTFAKTTTPRVVVAMYGYQMAGNAYSNYADTGAYVFPEYYDGYIRVVSDGKSYCDTVRSKERGTVLYAYYDIVAQKIYPPEK